MFDESREFGAIWDGQVLKPLERLDLDAPSKVIVSVRRAEVTPEGAAESSKRLHEIRRSGVVRLNGWHTTRDELHERG